MELVIVWDFFLRGRGGGEEGAVLFFPFRFGEYFFTCRRFSAREKHVSLPTAKGLKVVTAWVLKQGLPSQFSLATEQLYQ